MLIFVEWISHKISVGEQQWGMRNNQRERTRRCEEIKWWTWSVACPTGALMQCENMMSGLTSHKDQDASQLEYDKGRRQSLLTESKWELLLSNNALQALHRFCQSSHGLHRYVLLSVREVQPRQGPCCWKNSRLSVLLSHENCKDTFYSVKT